MPLVFGKNLDQWETLGAKKTVQEIRQQPVTWLKLINLLESKPELFQFVKDFQKEHPDGRVVISGSGSSTFIGDIAAPFLHYRKDYRFVSIPAPDLVTSPDHYLNRKVPTLMISVSRSGNNPESIGAYHLVSEEVQTYKHLIITCSESGYLANKAAKDPNTQVLIMPKEAEDEAYTNTGGFSSMLLSLLMLFENGPQERAEEIRTLAKIADTLLEEQWKEVSQLANEDFSKVLFIGSSAFKGLAEEGQLALLEMTSGKRLAFSGSTLSSRYTKRFIPDENSLTFVLFSSHPYARQYEEDLLNELYQNKVGRKVVAIAWKDWNQLSTYSHHAWIPTKSDQNYPGSGYASLFYLLYIQMFSLFSAVKLGVSPDQPIPHGQNKHEPKRGLNFAPYSSFL